MSYTTYLFQLENIYFIVLVMMCLTSVLVVREHISFGRKWPLFRIENLGFQARSHVTISE
jgi:hypothetical protein